MRYLEDFQVGQVEETGSYVVSREEILDFARKSDPQPFHLDDAAGAATHFGGLVASGWHTAAVGHRLLVDGLLRDTASLGSPGVDELRWLKPVRPGDTLRLRAECLEVKPSRSRPDMGAVRWRFELRNQDGEAVLSQIGIGLLQRRPS